MELKTGYKQTEVGLIPEDWKLEHLGEISHIDVGLSKPKIVFGSGCLVVTVQDIYDGSIIDVSGLKRVVISEEEIQKYKLTKDDILIGNASVKRDGIGYANRFNGAPEDVIFAKYAYRARALRSAIPLFLHHVLRAPFCRHWIISKSQTGTLTNLNKAAARGIPIPLPSTLVEQEAIAEALSDADALIESLVQLITKKRQIKQGAMQDLLTGKRRLPGFSGEWEVKRLGDVVEITKGQLITESSSIPGDVPVIAGGKKPAYFHNRANRTGKTVTISGSGASAGYVAFYDTPIFASDCSTIGEAKSYSVDFIYFVLLLNQEVIYKSQTGGAQPHIHPSDLRPLMIDVPTAPSEQTAIASALNDMEIELAALESRLAKARQIKQGMMQELLTGRIRLLSK